MPRLRFTGFVLSAFLSTSLCAYASSVGLSNTEFGQSFASSRSTPSFADSADAAAASSLAFGSSIVLASAGTQAGLSSFSSGSPGSRAALFAGDASVSPRCIVTPTPDPPPSVAPESSSALLFGLGFAALVCIGRLRSQVLEVRG